MQGSRLTAPGAARSPSGTASPRWRASSPASCSSWIAALALLGWLAAAPTLAAQQARTGQFDLSSTVEQLLEGASLASFSRWMPADMPIEWSVYVPKGYDAERPPGLLVYISPGDSGRMPREWLPIMERRNLIWIGAHDSGNAAHTRLRVAYAILAPEAIRTSHLIDEARVYLSGFSGGGRVASMIAGEYAHIFKGAIYNCGANRWQGDRPSRLEEMKANRYVFVTGSRDFNLRDTRHVYRAYEEAGIGGIQLMVVPGMAHRNPGRAKFEEAIEFLDGRLAGD